MITPSKKNGEPRRTVDLSDLNKACKRQTHHTKSPYHLASEVPKNLKKTCFDARNGFHSLELETKSRPYTKFITPWGAYQYKTSVATLLQISVQCLEIGHFSPGTSGKYPDLSGKYQKCLIIGLGS